MGCNTCRISQLDTEFFKACKTSKTSLLDFQPLLTLAQRNFWLKQIDIKGIPQQDFWTQFNGFHHTCITQIGKDINRTFPTLVFFSNKSHLSRFQLLLKKFAIYFPKIGYTQGLNFVAGYLLMCGFDDDSAFKVLVSLAVHQKILAVGLYEDNFPLNRFYCQVFWNLMNSKLPKVAQKIKKANVQDQIWIFQWFISFFLYSFPTQFVKKFWDFIILKKQVSMVIVALGIMRCLKSDILNMKNAEEFDFLQYFQNTKQIQFCKSKIDLKKMITFMNSINQQEIQRAISEAKCTNNQYQKYFTSSQYERNESYVKIMKNFKYQRTSFKANPDPRKYSRAIQAANQLENLVLSKYRLYQSQYKRSNVASSIFKMSTFSIAVDNPNSNSQLNIQNKQSNIFRNGFLNRINFTQSKVIENGFDLTNLKRQKNDSNLNENLSKTRAKGINPFDQMSSEKFTKHQTKNQKNNFKDPNADYGKNNNKIMINHQNHPVVYGSNLNNNGIKKQNEKSVLREASFHDFSKKQKPYYSGNY